MDVSAYRWRKSNRSTNQQGCVELAHTLDRVRDSKNPAGPALTFEQAELARFLSAVKSGRLNA